MDGNELAAAGTVGAKRFETSNPCSEKVSMRELGLEGFAYEIRTNDFALCPMVDKWRPESEPGIQMGAWTSQASCPECLELED